MKKTALIATLLLLCVGCTKPSEPISGSTPTASPSQAVSVAAQPTQQAALDHLRKTIQALDAKNYEEAAGYFKIPAGAGPDKVAKELQKLVDRHEISKAGVEKLAAKAKWGKLEEVFGAKRAKAWTDRSKVPLQDCYGLGVEPAEVGLYWDGSRFLIIRLDDVGKL